MSIKSCMVGLFLLAGPFLNGQTVNKPNYAIKSHETLEILSIEADSKSTVFHISIENRIPGGTFCADRNIWIVISPEQRSRLVFAEGIPVCPDVHHFTLPGESLDFTLVFPPLPPGIKSVDLIEECSENCFSFYGIVIDNDLNQAIDKAFESAEGGNTEDALKQFIEIAEDPGRSSEATHGLLYINIIRLAAERGYQATAERWYKKLKSEGGKEMVRYIDFLNAGGIKY